MMKCYYSVNNNNSIYYMIQYKNVDDFIFQPLVS